MFYKNKFRCRRRRECIGIRANCGMSLQVSCFFPYGFLTHGQDLEMAYTAPPETSLPSLSAPPQSKKLPSKISFLTGVRQ